MKRFALLFLALSTAALAEFSPEQRTVKIQVTQQAYNPTKPWTRLSAKEVSGSGLIYKPGYVLTNAHVVRNARQVYIQPYQSALRIEAEVVFYAPGIDLAVIRATDNSLQDFDSIEIDPAIPSVSETIKIFGYPKGGNELSITEGVISRIEFTGYSQGVQGLRLQVDAAINSGNSGGPVFAGDRFTGIVFSHVSDAENMSNIIPAEEVAHFLADVEDGQYDGKPYLIYEFSNLENDNLREMLSLDSKTGGQLVETADDFRIGAGGLKPMDILIKIGDRDIDRTGKITVRDDLRLSFRYLISHLARDGQLPVAFIRDGKRISADIPLSKDINMLIPFANEAPPNYFIYGPLTFATAIQEFAGGFSQKSLEQLASLGYEPIYRKSEYTTKAGEELVVCPAKMLPHPMTKGFRDPAYSVLKRVNGADVLNLAQMVDILAKLKGDDYVTFEFADVRHTRTNLIVLKHQEVIKAMDDLLADNGIRSPYSKNLDGRWSAY